MATDFLNNPQRYPGVAHLCKCRTSVAVGGSADDADFLASFLEQVRGGFWVHVLPVVVEVAAGEQVGVLGMFVGFQQQPQILNDGDSAGAEFAFGVAFADDHFGADDIRWGKDIDDFQTARFGNSAGGVEANSEEGAIAIGLQTVVK